MAIYKQAGTTFEASTPPLTTGLVGTIGVRIMDGQGGTTTARSTAGIVETPAASGIYAATLTAPAAGDYLVVWDTGGVTPTFGTEDLVVTTGPPTFASPGGLDLCTLADVRGRRSTPVAQTGQDAEVSRLITAVSAAISREVEREFIPTDDETRTFTYDPGDGDTLSLNPYDLRTITALQLNPDDTPPTTLDPTDYRLHPYPSLHGTFTAVRLRPSVVIPNATWGSTLVEITGDWGFAAVPADVREAAIVSVVHNMRTTVGQYSIADGAGGESRYERVEIPQAAKDLLNPYRRMS